MIPEKVNAQKAPDNYEEIKKELGDAYSSTLQKVAQVPKEKYGHPMTSNQELGWHADVAVPSKKFVFKRHQCPETTYAANYITMSHVSPFADQHKSQVSK